MDEDEYRWHETVRESIPQTVCCAYKWVHFCQKYITTTTSAKIWHLWPVIIPVVFLCPKVLRVRIHSRGPHECWTSFELLTHIERASEKWSWFKFKPKKTKNTRESDKLREYTSIHMCSKYILWIYIGFSRNGFFTEAEKICSAAGELCCLSFFVIEDYIYFKLFGMDKFFLRIEHGNSHND